MRIEQPSLAPQNTDSDYRSEIWRMFGKDRSAYSGRAVVSDDEMSDDMDPGFEEIMKEERLAERQAKRDDRREAERLRLHAEAKAKRKAR